MRLRTATLAELRQVLDWAAAEGWNPGLDDAEAFHAADPEGFFVAEMQGAPVAAISVVNHDPGLAFLGLYLCLPEWRRRGIGLALWAHALEHAGGRTVGLDGVPAQQANYRRSGFLATGATRRLEGPPAGTAPSGVRPAAADDLPLLVALDRAAQGYGRPAFLSTWLAPSAARRTLVLDRDGPRGFATVRACRQGVKVGPVVAPDAGAALALIDAAARELPADRVIVDVPEQNAALAGALAARGFAESFRTARMFRGPAPRPGSGLQAVGTLELG